MKVGVHHGCGERGNKVMIIHVYVSNIMSGFLTSIRMLRVRTPVRSTMPIHVATVVAPASATSASTAARRAASSAARPREEPSPAAVGVVLVAAEAAHEAAEAGAADAEHGGARRRVRGGQPPGDPAHRDQDDAHTCKQRKRSEIDHCVHKMDQPDNEQTPFISKLAVLLD